MKKSLLSISIIIIISISIAASRININNGGASQSNQKKSVSVSNINDQSVSESPLNQDNITSTTSNTIASQNSVTDGTLNVSQENSTTSTIDSEILQHETFSIHQEDDKIYGSQAKDNAKSIATLSSVTISSQVPTNSKNTKEVMGFLPYWMLSQYQSLQYDKLSTINYFALTCWDDGNWVVTYEDGSRDKGYDGFYSTSFSNMYNLAHANNVKVVLTVKNFHNESIMNLVSNLNGAGDRLIENIVSVLKTNNLDGVNIDFEYVPDPAHPVTTQLQQNFASWHDKLAKRIHLEIPGSYVSTDVFGSSAYPGTAYDLNLLGKTDLDHIMMMTYDYTTISYYSGKKIASVAPLYGNLLSGVLLWNVSNHIDQAIKELPSQKILMGIPYYGIDFPVSSGENSQYNAHVTGTGVLEIYSSTVDPKYDQWHNTSSIKWNDSEKVTWYPYNYNGQDRQGYYESPDTLRAKYDFAINRNLGGIGIWALGYDGTYPDLWNVIREKFQIVPIVVGFNTGTSSDIINQIFRNLNLTIVKKVDENIWIVIPNNEISSIKIQQLKLHNEVMNADFQTSPAQRNPSN